MEYKFYIGQIVRIGNKCNVEDINYHKRGKIVSVDEVDNITVDMIDPFSNGKTLITWCPKWLWEPCFNQICCESLL